MAGLRAWDGQPIGRGPRRHCATPILAPLLRIGDWKVLYFYEPRRFELYRLDQDLGEEHDLATSHDDQLRRLASRLIAELRRNDAQYPNHRELGRPEPPMLGSEEERDG